MIRISTDIKPTHPGEMLREEFLVPMDISQQQLAEAIHMPYQQIDELLNQQRSVTPSMALRLAKFFGMSADFWLNLQIRWDIFEAQVADKNELDAIQDFQHWRKIA
jgi:addiction module HigA family antidote